jgi:gluconolactonase
MNRTPSSRTKTQEPSVRVLAEGFEFPEGPAINAAGELWVCDVETQTLWKINTVNGTKTEWLRLHSGANGAAFDPAGNLLVAGNIGRTLVSIAPDKNVRSLFSGETVLNSPNDLTVSPEGTVYFTDPTWKEGWRQIPQGVYALTPDGKFANLGFFLQPNGIKWHRALVYFAEGATGKIYVWNPAQPEKPRVFAALKDFGALDGIDFDGDGFLYVSMYGMGALAVINPEGKEIRRLKLPGKNPTNLEFSSSGEILYVTEAEKKQVLEIMNFR